MVESELTIVLFEKDPLGDLDQNEKTDLNDAVRLLYHVFFPERYSLPRSGDMNGDGKVTLDDAIYLLYHVNFPTIYPLNAQRN